MAGAGAARERGAEQINVIEAQNIPHKKRERIPRYREPLLIVRVRDSPGMDVNFPMQCRLLENSARKIGSGLDQFSTPVVGVEASSFPVPERPFASF